MFPSNSRYAAADTYAARTRSGTIRIAIRLPIRARPALRGFHRRSDTQRPDLIAAHYLGDATASWRLCDAGGAVSPDALAARPLIAVPAGEP